MAESKTKRIEVIPQEKVSYLYWCKKCDDYVQSTSKVGSNQRRSCLTCSGPINEFKRKPA